MSYYLTNFQIPVAATLTLYFKNRFFQHQYQKKVKMFVFISCLFSNEVCVHMQYFFGVVRNKLQTLNIY